MSNKLKEKKFKNIRQKEWGREGLQRSNLLRIRIASNSDCFIRRGSSRKLGYSKLDKSTNKSIPLSINSYTTRFVASNVLWAVLQPWFMASGIFAGPRVKVYTQPNQETARKTPQLYFLC
ncbi:hypothetical protein M9H77_21422 [Catharanthus roseus]|uniref:Uncharacterized protein n=1 Tax=Catharanthus roseus TaxID=4058 RepID=A0ACC0APL2_CATRO|nr:hypothetical protein M9H77_21422 [Catharanthus roseus]